MNIGDLTIRVVPDVSGFGPKLKKDTERPAEDAGRTGSSKFASGFKSLISEVGVQFGADRILAFGQLISKGFGRLTSIEDATSKLKGLGFSAATVQSAMDTALASVKGTAFGLDEAATLAATAMASGVKPGADLRRELGLVADVATIAGTSMADIGDIFNEVAAKNKLGMDQVNRLAERGIPIMSLLAKQYGVTQEQAAKMVSDGKIKFADFERALESQVGGAALKSGQTTTGALSNIGAAASRLGASFLTGLYPFIKTVLGGLTNFADIATEHVKPLSAAAGALITQFVNGFKSGSDFGFTMQGIGGFARAAWEAVKLLWQGVVLAVKAFNDGKVTTGGFGGAMQTLGIAIHDVLGIISGLVKWVHDYWQIAAVLVGTTYALAAANAVLSAGGLLSYIKSLPTVIALTKAWSATQAALNLLFVASPIGFIILGIAALVAIVIYAWTHFEGFRKVVIATWEGIKAAAAVAWDILKRIYADIVDSINKTITFFVAFWHGAVDAWNAVVAGVRAAWAFLSGVFNAIVSALTTVLSPAFHAFQAVSQAVWSVVAFAVQAAWVVINVIFVAIRLVLEATLIPAFRGFMLVVQLVWAQIQAAFQRAWTFIQAIFLAIRGAIEGYVIPFFRLMLTAVSLVWQQLADRIGSIWNGLIKPFIIAFANIVTDQVVPKVRAGLGFVRDLWNGIIDFVKNPINITIGVINRGVINPFNSVAAALGLSKDKRIANIGTLATGGHVRGPGTETSDSIPVLLSDNEYVIPARTVRRLGVGFFDRLIGDMSPKARSAAMYADGGLIGDIFRGITGAGKAIWDAITDPVKAIQGPVNAALNAIPGGGMLREILVGAGHALVGHLVAWIKNIFSSGGGAIGAGPGFGAWPSSPAAQRGDSGVWRSIVALIRSTGPMSGSFGNAYRPGDPLWHGSGRAVDWMGFNQDGLATFFMNMRARVLELIHRTNQRDYAVTRGRDMGSFNNSLMEQHRNHIHIAMRRGGLVARFDNGGYLMPGLTLAANNTGQPEHVTTANGMDGVMARLDKLIAAVESVAPGVGDEMRGVSRGMIQAARAR